MVRSRDRVLDDRTSTDRLACRKGDCRKPMAGFPAADRAKYGEVAEPPGPSNPPGTASAFMNAAALWSPVAKVLKSLPSSARP